jgi:hypothetical protein
LNFSKGKLGVGLPLQMQWRILDAIFYAAGNKMMEDFKDTSYSQLILNEVSTANHQSMNDQPTNPEESSTSF